MRKIISILLALGMILGLSAMAAPVAAAPCVCPTTSGTFDILTPPFCAGAASNYLIGTVTPFVVPVTLIAGTDSLSVDFPAGTDLSSVVFGGVFIDAFPLDNAASLVKSGTHLEARIPVAAGNLIALTPHSMQVNGVINTATPGTYCLYVDYKLACCDAVQFACKTYTVVPATATYDFVFDFGLTYAGIAEGCIPPFKACGQAGYGHPEAVGWVTDFNVILRDVVPGCSPPCAVPSAFWFEVTKCPVGEVITFNIQGVTYTLDSTDITTPVTKYALLWAGWPPPDVVFPAWIHFSSPGDYEIKFFVQCPSTGCPACGGPTIVAEEALPATAYQYKDAFKLTLVEKWNLISLPLYPFNTDIASIFGCMSRIDQLASVWYFDQCADPDPNEGVWSTEVYDGTDFTPGTMDIVAGKAYWVRMLEPGETGYDPTAFPASLWVWGTHASMPPSSPMGYFDVCQGWNMVGFKAPWVAGVPVAEADNLYLWNFNTGVMDTVHYGLIYDWVEGVPGDWTFWTPGTLAMQPGTGYWIPFDGDGTVYPAP